MSEVSKRVLSALLVMGAQSAEKAMTGEELAAKLGVTPEAVGTELKELIDAGYAQVVEGEVPTRVYLTGTGIITASSTYS